MYTILELMEQYEAHKLQSHVGVAGKQSSFTGGCRTRTENPKKRRRVIVRSQVKPLLGGALPCAHTEACGRESLSKFQNQARLSARIECAFASMRDILCDLPCRTVDP